MKSILTTILFIFCTQTNLFSQENNILPKELAEVTINAKPKKKINYTTFDLMGKKFLSNQSLRVPLLLDTNNNIGAFVPMKAKRNLIIKDVVIPTFKFNNADTSLNLTYFLGLKYASGYDTVFQVMPDQIQNDNNQLKLAINATIPLNSSIDGFYFFIKYIKKDLEKYSNINIYFNNKYRSRFTHRLNQLDNIEEYDITQWLKKHVLRVKDAGPAKVLNWRVKITYLTS